MLEELNFDLPAACLQIIESLHEAVAVVLAYFKLAYVGKRGIEDAR